MFHVKRFTSKTQKIGELGEKICAAYLLNKDYKIIERNYTKKSGEIDIIAMKNEILYFIEVKSTRLIEYVSHETYNPAENLTKKKFDKINETIKEYLFEKDVSHETSWQTDLYCVYIDTKENMHKISILENIIIN